MKQFKTPEIRHTMYYLMTFNSNGAMNRVFRERFWGPLTNTPLSSPCW